MFFFDNFIITQRTLYMISGFIILFLGTVINFALGGLFNKKSQKFSNILTITTLILSSLSFLPFLFGFLNPYSIKSIYFFNKHIAFGGLEIFLCLISQLTILILFLISKKHLKAMRFKQYYFNSLYLCSALAIDLLVISRDFIAFILSLEIIGICALFIILAFKNRNVFYNAFKYLAFSFVATIIMIFAYIISNAFTINYGALPVCAKILFIIALLIKGGFALTFSWGQQNIAKQNFTAFAYINTVIFFAYLMALHKTVHTIFETGSFAQIFFTLFFISCAILSSFKILRTQNFKDYVYLLNTANFSILGFLFFIQNIQIHTAAILLTINALIVNFGLLSAGSIISTNRVSNLDYENFNGICYSNPLFCNLLSIVIFISSAIVPTGIFVSKFYANIALAQTGLWSSIVMFLLAFVYSLVIAAAINFVTMFYKKPNNFACLEKFKKRTNINYSILFISIIASLALCIFNGYATNLITSFL